MYLGELGGFNGMIEVIGALLIGWFSSFNA